MRQVARQLVQLDERRGRVDEVEAALQLLEAETALGEVLVKFSCEPFPVLVRCSGP